MDVFDGFLGGIRRKGIGWSLGVLVGDCGGLC